MLTDEGRGAAAGLESFPRPTFAEAKAAFSRNGRPLETTGSFRYRELIPCPP